ncbi:MAG: hypothetical protein ACKO4K_02730 [Flavobacteriales bacterium]|jgi:gliding motility-associated lipoprotein GldD
MKPVAFLIIGVLAAIIGCSEEVFVPKPKVYLRPDLPNHNYVPKTIDHGFIAYSFLMPSQYSPGTSCDDTLLQLSYFRRDEMKRFAMQSFELSPIQGWLNMYTCRFDTQDSLAKLLNYSIKLKEDHILKADGIESMQINNPKENVYGTLFTLKGNVASNFHFHLTDSVSRFVMGIVELDATPNYDSLKPTLDYIKKDLEKITQSFQWKNLSP